MSKYQWQIRSLLLLSSIFATRATPITQPSPTSIKAHEAERTFVKRAEPSAYPWPDNDDPILENEFKWLGWDVNNEEDKRDGKKIHKAFREWHDLVVAGGKSAVAYQKEGPERDRFKRWFGEQEFPEEAGETFKLMINLDTKQATVNIASMVNDRRDFAEIESKRCSAKPNMNAYTVPATGQFHFCRRGIDQPLGSELESKCGDFGSSVSGMMRSVSMTFLHEATHYDRHDGTNEGIVDFIGGSTASGSFGLEDENKIRNAQNYAWFAADAYWSAKCGKTFGDPPPGTNEQPEDFSDAIPRPIFVPSQPTKALSIVADVGYKSMQNHDLAVVDWKFFATDYGKAVAARTDSALQERRTENIDNQIYPGGIFDFILFDEVCQYRNNGMNAGKLFCSNKAIECVDDPAYKNLPLRGFPEDGGRDSYWTLGNIRQPVYTCAY